MSCIPQIDISKIGLSQDKVTSDSYQEIGKLLHSAFSTFGFVYLLNHGIPKPIVKDTFDESRKFFALSDEQKAKYERDPTTYMGYLKPGLELLDKLKEEQGPKAYYEIRESYNVMRIADDKTSSDGKFPDELVPEFRTAFYNIGKQLEKLGSRVMKCVAISLDQEEDFFEKCHQKMFTTGNSTTLKSLYYPAINESVPAGIVRCGEHADYSTLTFLFQDEMGGLEVKGTSQGWIPAKPIPDTIVVNVGEFMEIFTNGIFPATRHRVIVPKEEVVRKKPRESLAFFISPDDDILIQPINGEKPKLNKYQPITPKQYIENRFAETIGTKS